MTTPVERTRALRLASELLQDLVQVEELPAALRVRVLGVLRHYPEEWQLRMMAEDWQLLRNPTFGLAPEPGRPDPPLAPRPANAEPLRRHHHPPSEPI